MDLGGPARVERVALGFNRNIRVDQRPAADAGARRHGHVRKHPQVEPAVELRWIVRIEHPGIGRLAWKRVRAPLAPALEDDHFGAGQREAARRHRPAES
jgi:hypothetical protein